MRQHRSRLIAISLSLLALASPLVAGCSALKQTNLQQPATVALAKNPGDVARVAKTITVRIAGVASQGSGVLVKKEGNRYTVLTAWHVVEGINPGEELAIYTPDGKEHQLEGDSIERLGEVDMAVLSFISTDFYKLAVIGDRKSIRYEDSVYLAGFPLTNPQN